MSEIVAAPLDPNRTTGGRQLLSPSGRAVGTILTPILFQGTWKGKKNVCCTNSFDHHQEALKSSGSLGDQVACVVSCQILASRLSLGA